MLCDPPRDLVFWRKVPTTVHVLHRPNSQIVVCKNGVEPVQDALLTLPVGFTQGRFTKLRMLQLVNQVFAANLHKHEHI